MRIASIVRLFLLAAALVALPQAASAQARTRAFDHLRTGFPLTGAHAVTPCETCHTGGRMAGTPKMCASCHRAGSRLAVTVMPVRHLPTAEPCENCHRSAITWSGARFSHVGVPPGGCLSCHNGGTASGKPANHVATTASCDGCHRTVAWLPAGFNHANVVPGTCATCHGSSATGKPANHMPTTASCDACHSTRAWRPALFNHANVTPGTCQSCHNGSGATGMPSGHMVTTRSCDACHTSTSWLPARPYTHLSPAWKPHSAAVTCYSCHTTHTETATWNFAVYKPNCAGCHANRFVPSPHKKTDVPTTVFYTVAELQDCSGACHIYTNNTFTTILRARSGQHRSTSGGF